ncbi:MAG: histidine ammonia-lyase [Chlamydiales bacterium]|nr:histidine ammonia-lyase [Chlamydiia bacterium]MCP5507682.1 histidine ammonia-lyase [Chlamydiales bacterium]
MTTLCCIEINGKDLSLEKAASIAYGAGIELGNDVELKLERAHSYVVSVARQAKAVYGINTGFGYFANKKISKDKLLHLQENILKSHAAGWGDPLPIPETRLAVALRLNVLVKGHTGVRIEICNLLKELINREIYPLIPEYGSVGASGDLAPLAHLALPLIGHGRVLYKGKVIPSKEALAQAGLEPIILAEKEGLGLINGTQIMLSVGGLALWKALELLEYAEKITALTYEAMVGSPNALHPYIHELRNQKGQQISAERILNQLEGSYLFDLTTERNKVQDSYSIRCAPQVHGPSREALDYAKGVIERELNAVTDNPLVFPDEELILSGGNFHGQPLAMAYDFAAMAVAELGNISERRLELLLNPHLSGLPAFLAPDEGVDSGYMAAQYLSASLVNENKILANPACTDSIPGNVGVEDHVSMGMTSARKLKKIIENTYTILAAEMVAAAQAIDMRGITKLGLGTGTLYRKLRSVVPQLTEDRIISDDIAKAREILHP